MKFVIIVALNFRQQEFSTKQVLTQPKIVQNTKKKKKKEKGQSSKAGIGGDTGFGSPMLKISIMLEVTIQ